MEENTEAPPASKKRKISLRKMLRNSTIVILALSFAYIHRSYVAKLFENGRHFSHLSTLEREMSLRSEMGFYYSYYKTIVEEKLLHAAWYRLHCDTKVEHPKMVDALKRFNIVPEMLIGQLYRRLEPTLNRFDRECHTVYRGEGLPLVQSCNSLAEPMVFYLEAIWCLAGLMVIVVFAHACILSESILGGTLAVIQYFANHADGTRVHWAPNERENFAAPLFFLQAYLLTKYLRDRNVPMTFFTFFFNISIIYVLNVICFLFWQFSQFLFLTQLAIFFMMEQLKVINGKPLWLLLMTHLCGLNTAILLQGNDMLKTSLFASFFICISVYMMFFSRIRMTMNKTDDLVVEMWLVPLRIFLLIFASIYVKKTLSDYFDCDEDSHIWDILLSKLSDYKNFNTLIYTCSDVFGFLPFKTVADVSVTLLLPSVMLVICFLCNYYLKRGSEHVKMMLNPEKIYMDDSQGADAKESAEVLMQAIDTNVPEEQVGEIVTINKKERNDKRKNKKDKGLPQPPVKQQQSNVTQRKRNKKKGKRATEEQSSTTDQRQVDLDKLDIKYEDIQIDTWIEFLRGVNIDPAIFYNISQLFVFGIMALFIMRLKLLFVPQLCIVSALIANTKYHIKPVKGMMIIFWLACFGYVLYIMAVNVSVELAYIGEFSDPSQEQLLHWIMNQTKPVSSFAGSMPLMASVMLSTRRPIVAHPHYENAEARERAQKVYKMYGRFSAQELYDDMLDLEVAYIVVETQLCYGSSSQGCSFLSIWDAVSPSMSKRNQLCRELLTQRLDHFHPVFANDKYTVFLVYLLSVIYVPELES